MFTKPIVWLFLASIGAGSVALTRPTQADDALNLGNRRELFVDAFLIDTLDGAEQRPHLSTAKEVAIVHCIFNDAIARQAR